MLNLTVGVKDSFYGKAIKHLCLVGDCDDSFHLETKPWLTRILVNQLQKNVNKITTDDTNFMAHW